MRRFRIHGKILLCFVIFAIIANLGTILLGGQSGEELSMTQLMILSSSGLAISALVVYYAWDRRSHWKLGFTSRGAVRHTLQGMGLGLLLMSLSFVAIGLFHGYEIVSVNAFSEIAPDLLVSLLLFILVAVAEELFCRGYIQGLLKQQYGINTSLFVSSLLFALLHAGNPGIFATPFTMVNIFLIGLLFALTRELTGSLWMPIGIHFAWNFSQGNLFGFAVSGTDASSLVSLKVQGAAWLSGGEFGAEGSVAATFFVIIVCLMATARFRNRTSSANLQV